MLGSRLEEIFAEEHFRGCQAATLITDESMQRQLLQEDEEEDFLDEGEYLGCQMVLILSYQKSKYWYILRIAIWGIFIPILYIYIAIWYIYIAIWYIYIAIWYILVAIWYILIAIWYILPFCLAASFRTAHSSCPVALKMVACVLLLEITTFLRETYRNLPRNQESISRITVSAKIFSDTLSPFGQISVPNSRYQIFLAIMNHILIFHP
jgi:hypothetical protein